MRIVFMGTPAVAVPSLELLRAQHEIALVVTQPDKPAGRGNKLSAGPVKTRALELGLPVVQPTRARDDAFLEELRAAKPETLAVVAYGQILPQSVLDLPREFFNGGASVNLHFSLLPRWRGAAPVQHAILAGDFETGISTQWMAFKLDAGDIIMQERVPINPDETGGELLTRLAEPGARVLAQTLQLVASGHAARVPQDETQITLAPQFSREHGKLNWTRSTLELHNQVRALNPWPGAWCIFRGEVLKVWKTQPVEEDITVTASDERAGTLLAEGGRLQVRTGGGALELLEVQSPGKGRLSAREWARGARLEPNEALS